MEWISIIICIALLLTLKEAQKTLKILTFNVWNLRGISQDNDARMKAISEEFLHPTPGGALHQHDVILLQEVWQLKTVQLFADNLSSIYPYSHAFRNGVIGSGLLILSKYPIIKISFMQFILNGRASRFYEGDWFAGKGVGMARIMHPSGIIDVFTTHLIADYSDEAMSKRDVLLPHRLTQTHQMMEFIETHRHPLSIATILAGDFNIEMDSLPWRAFMEPNPFLKSIFKDLPKRDRPCTCNCALNPYHSPMKKPITIDNILYDPSRMTLKNSTLAFTKHVDIIPHFEDFSPIKLSYSDHFAVSAIFTLAKPKSIGKEPPEKKIANKELSKKVIDVLEQEILSLHNERNFEILTIVILFITLFLMYGTSIYGMGNYPGSQRPSWLRYIILFFLPFLIGSLIFKFVKIAVSLPEEKHALEYFVAELTIKFRSQ